jgi:hypothetical protein
MPLKGLGNLHPRLSTTLQTPSPAVWMGDTWLPRVWDVWGNYWERGSLTRVHPGIPEYKTFSFLLYTVVIPFLLHSVHEFPRASPYYSPYRWVVILPLQSNSHFQSYLWHKERPTRWTTRGQKDEDVILGLRMPRCRGPQWAWKGVFLQRRDWFHFPFIFQIQP